MVEINSSNIEFTSRFVTLSVSAYSVKQLSCLGFG